MRRRRLLKRLYGVRHFYTDSEKRFEFYYRKNWMDQFDVMVHDTESNSGRWFMVTAPVFFTMLNLEKENNIRAYKENIMKGPKPRVANELLHNHAFNLVAHKLGKFNGETVIAKLGDFGPEDNRQVVLLLKRVASVPEKDMMVLGMDTIEIPLEGVSLLVNDIKKRYFKDVEINIDFEEDENATN